MDIQTDSVCGIVANLGSSQGNPASRKWVLKSAQQEVSILFR